MAHAWTCPNLPGHGPEPTLDCSPEATIERVQAQAEALHTTLSSDNRVAATTPRVLLGYSMGARAALLHAVAHPTCWDAIILISANPGIEDESERTARAASDTTLAERIMTDGVPAFLEYWQQTPMIRSQQQIRADWQAPMQQNRLQHSAEGLAASLKQFGPAACPTLWSQLERLHCPILLISGEQDRKYCAIAERMQQALPQAKWAKIPQAGHMPHLEAPEATAFAVQAFLYRL